MTRILHLAELEHWQCAQASGEYTQSTRGAVLENVGFIHCSSPEQLPLVAAFIYADFTNGLVVLELDAAAIANAGVEIRMEDGGNGEPYPHLYGSLHTEWISKTYPAEMADGVLIAPTLHSEPR
ncbi:hypothetical protein CQ018_10270 [Arthrobacter sp. MYb227]|uniref:DUF952 domain-containing protein n=1 Tax=Arthrobacter sp. MYb227 TaxID=1848601 RepID=UPI000CFAE118|nr:DUF952 domain-containing protein [Arthrobacter sp. MYb227]PQZ92858.1 hypothetical protein CQ018_10270 [Arthrobacter sp. MYb227]